MPRFFFTLRCGSRVFPDRVGTELDEGQDISTGVALAYVARYGPSLAALERGCVVEVWDERRRMVMEIPVPANFWSAPPNQMPSAGENRPDSDMSWRGEGP